jgi:hypothetical protein
MVVNMVAIPQIPQNIFYIILAVIALVGLIFVILQWRMVKVSKTNVAFLTKEAEIRKIELVERDLESKHMMNDIVLTKNHQEKLSQIKENTTDLMTKVGYVRNEINERVNHIDTTTEYKKLQKLLKDIDEKEKELEMKTNKFKI